MPNAPNLLRETQVRGSLLTLLRENWRLSERELATQLVISEQGRWYTALPRPLFAFAFVIYAWKVVVWDKVLGLGTTGTLSEDMGQWATIVLTAYFGGRSIEKVARILSRK